MLPTIAPAMLYILFSPFLLLVCEIFPHIKAIINLNVNVNMDEDINTGFNMSNKNDPNPDAIPPATGPSIIPDNKHTAFPR